MTEWATIAIAIGAVVSAVGLVGNVIAVGILVGQVKADLKAHKEALGKVSEALELVPVLNAELGMVKSGMAKLASLFPKMDSRLSVVESKVVSIKEMQRVQSSHDWRGRDE